MDKFVVEGGNKLSGTLKPSGSKNEALPIIAATLLTDDPVTLYNVPVIADVLVILQILEELGSSVEWHDKNTVTICNRGVASGKLPFDLCRRLRASILLAGPLLARVGEVTMPPPGGDVLGRRRLDTHFLGLAALGASIEADQLFRLRAGELTGGDIFLDQPSVTGTENVIMAAALAKGRTIIRNAACEPHVQGLCNLLIAMGAQISGLGSNKLVIEGQERLNGCQYRISSDYLEIGSFIGLAAVTGSELTITDVNAEDLRMIRLMYAKLGIEFDLRSDGTLYVPADQSMTIMPDFGQETPVIDDAPWPMMPTDMMSIMITVATQCRGTVLFFEKMFDGRMFFIDNLARMGGNLILCDPHRVVVTGPRALIGSAVESPDVRAGMSLLIASLCAKGESTIYNIQQIDRGYENIENKLIQLGANIRRLPA